MFFLRWTLNTSTDPACRPTTSLSRPKAFYSLQFSQRKRFYIASNLLLWNLQGFGVVCLVDLSINNVFFTQSWNLEFFWLRKKSDSGTDDLNIKLKVNKADDNGIARHDKNIFDKMLCFTFFLSSV